MTENVSNMHLRGQVRREALRKMASQLQKWDMQMPSVDPLVKDFGVSDFWKVGLIEYWIANEIEAGYCAKYLFLFEDQRCPAHSHSEKHETFHILRGKVSLQTDGSEEVLKSGEVSPVAAGYVHTFQAVEGAALILEISTPCRVADNKFVNDKIEKWLDLSV